MRINPLVQTSLDRNISNTKNTVSFGTYNPVVARKIQRALIQKGIECDSKGNDFVAECYKKTVDVFEKLFKKSYLPSKLSFETLDSSTYGVYINRSNQVILNEYRNYECYYNMENLTKEAQKNHRTFLPSWSSTDHPAHTFVHEFAHAAHWNHLEQRNGYNNAIRVWHGLEGTTVPTAIGKLITKFKLGKYAVEANDMCEFLAERITKDICSGLSRNNWILLENVDVDYSNIFSKKWNYRYSSPQSYIDYFTQQVWNGHIDEANKVGSDAAAYLAEIEAKEYPPFIDKIDPPARYSNPTRLQVVTTDGRTVTIDDCEATQSRTPSLFSDLFGGFLRGTSSRITRTLDERNKIALRG